MSGRRAAAVLGLEAAVTAAVCAAMLVAAPRVFRTMRRRYGCMR